MRPKAFYWDLNFILVFYFLFRHFCGIEVLDSLSGRVRFSASLWASVSECCFSAIFFQIECCCSLVYLFWCVPCWCCLCFVSCYLCLVDFISTVASFFLLFFSNKLQYHIKKKRSNNVELHFGIKCKQNCRSKLHFSRK